jgi:hypothetical protein
MTIRVSVHLRTLQGIAFPMAHVLRMDAGFSGFALGEKAPLQQLGFGLAIAVLVDASILRCILVSASMRLWRAGTPFTTTEGCGEQGPCGMATA